MAKETKIEKEITVEEKLQSLYTLQKVVSKIDEIKTLRGELPLEVQDLDDEIAGLKTRIENYATEATDKQAQIAEQKAFITETHAKIARYKEQQDNVRNNREYDNLSKEIEFQTLNVMKAEKDINTLTAKKEEIIATKETTMEILNERKLDLKQKKAELNEIVSETKHEEENLRNQSKKLETSIESRLLTAFKRIRKNARNGLAVVSVNRGSCGGCFNKIPAQRQLDIRLRKKIIVCEYCGRILVDNELTAED
jgi:predicted  nucleic acid-binding Zn-ribbon protein